MFVVRAAVTLSMFSSRTFNFFATTSTICSAKFATKASSFIISISLAAVESSLVELCLCVELGFERTASLDSGALDNGALAVKHQLTLSER